MWLWSSCFASTLCILRVMDECKRAKDQARKERAGRVAGTVGGNLSSLLIYILCYVSTVSSVCWRAFLCCMVDCRFVCSILCTAQWAGRHTGKCFLQILLLNQVDENNVEQDPIAKKTILCSNRDWFLTAANIYISTRSRISSRTEAVRLSILQSIFLHHPAPGCTALASSYERAGARGVAAGVNAASFHHGRVYNTVRDSTTWGSLLRETHRCITRPASIVDLIIQNYV